MEPRDFLKKFRKAPVCPAGSLKHAVSYGVEDIKRTITHRDPFLLLDRIEAIDLEKQAMIATRHIAASDPVFRGHFPEFPVYPGTLLLEMMGQVASCASFFLGRGNHLIPADAKPVYVRVTKILGADFLEPVLPGSDVTISGIRIEWDVLSARFGGQAIVKNKVCCVAVAELYLF